MKVVLLDNIRGIGRVGDIKDVSDGYARNFLLKRGLAKAATQGAVKDAAVVKAKKLESSALAQEEARQAAGRIKGMVVNITAKANKQGKLFAAVEAQEIAQAASAVAGLHIAPDQLKLEEPLKTVGDHPVTIALTEDASADITVSITAK